MARWLIETTGTLPNLVSLFAGEKIFAVGYDVVGRAWVGLRRTPEPGTAPGRAWGAADPVTVPGTAVRVVITANDLYEPAGPWPLDAPACWREAHGGELLTVHGRIVLAELIRERFPDRPA